MVIMKKAGGNLYCNTRHCPNPAFVIIIAGRRRLKLCRSCAAIVEKSLRNRLERSK